MNLFYILLVCIHYCLNDCYGRVHHHYCIIGAGPSGLQMGYFLERANRDYIIFEKGKQAGTFYTKYPIHRTLISINKIYTGKSNKEFNLRHDWNSLISDNEDLLVGKYSKDFFPSADIYVQYLNDFATKLKLNVQYETTIVNVGPKNTSDNLFYMNDLSGTGYTCNTTIVATGISKPRKVDFAGHKFSMGYEDLKLNRSKFEGKAVLILGKGNSAFETAEYLTPVTSYIHMLSRSQVKLSWETHYVGDLRAINNGLLDTYQLKSLNGVLEGDISHIEIFMHSDGRLYIKEASENSEWKYDNDPTREGYDYIIRCLGFEFDASLFHKNVTLSRSQNYKIQKYPRITYQYQSMDVPGLYFAGTNTHSLDFGKSAGGFIHGFRYTTRTLHRILEWKNFRNPWPSLKFKSPIDVMAHVLKRLNEASDIYQMFSVLCEVIILPKTGDDSIKYLEAFPCSLTSRISKVSGHDVSAGVIIVSLEYGKNFSGVGKNIFREDRATGEAADAHNSNFLHPIFYYYKSLPSDESILTRPKKWILPIPDKIFHLVEDFTTKFDAETTHIVGLRRFFESIMVTDLRGYLAEQCLYISLTNLNVPDSCKINHAGVQPSEEARRTLHNLKPSLVSRVPVNI